MSGFKRESTVSRSSLPIIDSGILEKLERIDHPLIAPELAQMFRSSVQKVYRLARNNVIPSFRFGGSVLFDGAKVARRLRGEAVA